MNLMCQRVIDRFVPFKLCVFLRCWKGRKIETSNFSMSIHIYPIDKMIFFSVLSVVANLTKQSCCLLQQCHFGITAVENRAFIGCIGS